jgi:hypothetical protein
VASENSLTVPHVTIINYSADHGMRHSGPDPVKRLRKWRTRCRHSSPPLMTARRPFAACVGMFRVVPRGIVLAHHYNQYPDASAPGRYQPEFETAWATSPAVVLRGFATTQFATIDFAHGKPADQPTGVEE